MPRVFAKKWLECETPGWGGFSRERRHTERLSVASSQSTWINFLVNDKIRAFGRQKLVSMLSTLKESFIKALSRTISGSFHRRNAENRERLRFNATFRILKCDPDFLNLIRIIIKKQGGTTVSGPEQEPKVRF